MKTENKTLHNGSIQLQNRHIGSHICLIFWSLLVLFPLWVMIINSFKDRLSIYENPFWLPQKWNFQNYAAILHDGDFLNYFKNSFVFVILSITLVLLIGALASYDFANWHSRMPNMLFLFMIAGMMLPIKIASIKLLE